MGARRGNKYSEDDIKRAVQAVKDGMPFKTAAKSFGVPRSTIQFRCGERFSKTAHGPPPVLSEEEENTLVRWIYECARKGFPRRKEDIQMSVKEFLEKNSRENPFKGNMPGNKWYLGFLRRHPNISCRSPEGVTAASACVAKEDVEGWFNSVQDILQEENVFHILSDPKRVFNGDETNFMLCPKKNLVLAPSGSKNVYEVELGQAKSTLTVMCTFSAAGKVCPPMIIYPLQRIPQEIVRKIPEKWGVGRSENGWMKSELFFEYIGNVFYPYVVENNIPLPVILFVDGHKTHLTYHLSELCKELKIVLVALYPNSTRILQPADVAAFKPVKGKWKEAVLSWRAENPNKAVTKEDFAPILERMFKNINLEASLKNGFRATGLCPWNVDAVDFSKCLGKRVSTVSANTTPRPCTQILQYDEFCKVVGEKRIEDFTKIKEISGQEKHGEDFIILYKLWERFHRKDDGKNEITSLLDVPNVNRESDEQDVVLNSPQISSQGPLTCDEGSNGVHQDSQDSASEVPLTTEQYTRDDHLELNDDKNATKVTPTKAGSLHGVLHWPETPKRKGKRNTERIPFVLTSGKWKETYEAKKKLKEDALKEKERRKLEREEKRILKQASFNVGKRPSEKGSHRNPKIAKTSSFPLDDNEPSTSYKRRHDISEGTFDKETYGMCFKCTRSVGSSKKGFECSSCKRLYHQTCIPKDHQIHIPDDSDEDLFVCHVCFAVQNDSDDDYDLFQIATRHTTK